MRRHWLSGLVSTGTALVLSACSGTPQSSFLSAESPSPGGPTVVNQSDTARANERIASTSWNVVLLSTKTRATGIASGAAGSIYFSRPPKSSLTILSSTGELSNFGHGLSKPQGVAANGKVAFVADLGNAAVKRISAAGQVTTLGSGWRHPQDVAFSKGSLYVTDSPYLKKIDKDGNTTTVLTDTSDLSGCGDQTEFYGVAADAQQNVYVSCLFGTAVYKVTPDGTATQMCGSWQNPTWIAAYGKSDLLVVDNNLRIFICSQDGQKTQVASNYNFHGGLKGIARQRNSIIISAYQQARIYKLTPLSN